MRRGQSIGLQSVRGHVIARRSISTRTLTLKTAFELIIEAETAFTRRISHARRPFCMGQDPFCKKIGLPPREFLFPGDQLVGPEPERLPARQRRWSAANQVRRLFGHHHNAGIDMRRHQIGHGRGIDDAQVFDAVYP